MQKTFQAFIHLGMPNAICRFLIITGALFVGACEPQPIATTVGTAGDAQSDYCKQAAKITPGATLEQSRRSRAGIDVELSGGRDIDNSGDLGMGTMLHMHALGGDVANVRYLIKRGADVEVPDINGGTPLVAAVVGCHDEVAAVLMEAGANQNARDKTLGTPIELATNTGQIRMLQILSGDRPSASSKSATVSDETRACDRGDARACNDLADRYRTGSGVASDTARAATLFRKACDGGNASGCSNLGMMYIDGNGVEQDYSEAASFSRKACDLGQGWGCNNLGYLYRQGKGVSRDHAQAAALFRQACNLGVSMGCNNLQRFYP